VIPLSGSGCAIDFVKALVVRAVEEYLIGALLTLEALLGIVDVVEDAPAVVAFG